MSRITQATHTRGAAPSHAPPDMTFAPGASLAHAMGWFSLGLGLAQLLAPRALCRATGLRSTALMQCCGLREIASGIAVLSCSRPTVGMWSRVGGDVIDLAILTDAMLHNEGEDRVRSVEAAAAVAGATALDLAATVQLTAASRLVG